MPRIEIEIRNAKKLREAFRLAPALVFRELTTAIYKGALIIQRTGRQESPVDTGAMRGGIGVTFGVLMATIAPKSKYAIYVHEGTKPHFPPIQSITGKEESLDKWARRHGVNPFMVARGIARRGTKGNPFMQRAAEKSRPSVQAVFDQAFTAIMRGI